MGVFTTCFLAFNIMVYQLFSHCKYSQINFDQLSNKPIAETRIQKRQPERHTLIPNQDRNRLKGISVESK